MLISGIILIIIMLTIQFKLLKEVLYLDIIIPIASSLSIITTILLLLINPGIIYSDIQNKGVNNNEQKIYCNDCKFLYPSTNIKMEHCHKCAICVCKYDHHCGVVGKCVGKFNIFIFLSFNLSSAGLITSFYLILFNIIFRLFSRN